MDLVPTQDKEAEEEKEDLVLPNPDPTKNDMVLNDSWAWFMHFDDELATEQKKEEVLASAYDWIDDEEELVTANSYFTRQFVLLFLFLES